MIRTQGSAQQSLSQALGWVYRQNLASGRGELSRAFPLYCYKNMVPLEKLVSRSGPQSVAMFRELGEAGVILTRIHGLRGSARWFAGIEFERRLLSLELAPDADLDSDVLSGVSCVFTDSGKLCLAPKQRDHVLRANVLHELHGSEKQDLYARAEVLVYDQPSYWLSCALDSVSVTTDPYALLRRAGAATFSLIAHCTRDSELPSDRIAFQLSVGLALLCGGFELASIAVRRLIERPAARRIATCVHEYVASRRCKWVDDARAVQLCENAGIVPQVFSRALPRDAIEPAARHLLSLAVDYGWLLRERRVSYGDEGQVKLEEWYGVLDV